MRPLTLQAIFSFVLQLCVAILLSFSAVSAEDGTNTTNSQSTVIPVVRDTATPTVIFRAFQDSLLITATASNQSWQLSKNEITRTENRLAFGRDLFVTDSTLEFTESTGSSTIILKLNEISSVTTVRKGKAVEVRLFTRPTDNPAARLRRGNLAAGVSDILIDSARFVRGSVVALGGEIEVDGEVDKTVFTVIGDIRLTSSALVRGNVVSLFGNVEVSDRARFYGEAIGAANGRRKLRILTSSQFGIEPVVSYDRVDGLTLGLGASYPNDKKQRWKVSSQLAYAFASDRVRGGASASYQLLKNKKLSATLAGYRQLSHVDDRLTTRFENTVLSLTFKEDLWDWYESTGGTFKLEWSTDSRWSLGLGYRNEMIKWLPAHENLWAISGGSGGSHRFRENFSTIPVSYDSSSTDDFSSSAPESRISELFARLELPSSPMMKNYSQSGFYGELWGDVGGIGINSGASYSRVGGSIFRSQKLHRHVAGVIGIEGAAGEKNLPAYRLFSIGGFATVPGYNLREFVGNSYFLLKTELRLSLKSKVAAVGLLADYARISKSDGSESFSDLSDLGIRLYLSGLVHLTAAVPTTRESDRTVKFWLSLRHAL